MAARASADVAIVGAGPAGARAAERLAASGVEVLLLDPRAPWEKPCGGGLPSTLFDAFPDLAPLRGDARPVARARIERSPDAGFEVELERPIWMIPRKALSSWQLGRATAAGAAHDTSGVVRIRRRGGGWLLETPEGSVHAGFLIGADGAASLVRRIAAPRLEVGLEPTRVSYPRGAGPDPGVLLLRFYEEIAGYLWDFPRPDHRSVGIVVPARSWSRARMEEEIDAHRFASESSAEREPSRAGAVIGSALHDHGDFSGIAGDRFALLGDAAGLADPLTGEGIQNAILSGELFAEAWVRARGSAPEAVRQYRAGVAAVLGREFAVARWLRHALYETGLGARIVARGGGSDVAYAFCAALLNTLGERDLSPGHGLRRILGAYLGVRRAPSLARRGPRQWRVTDP